MPLFPTFQVPINTPDGIMYTSRFSYINEATHLAIVNPVTGEQQMVWTHMKTVDAIYAIREFDCKNNIFMYSFCPGRVPSGALFTWFNRLFTGNREDVGPFFLFA